MLLRHIKLPSAALLLSGVLTLTTAFFPPILTDFADWYALVGGSLLLLIAFGSIYRDIRRARSEATSE